MTLRRFQSRRSPESVPASAPKLHVVTFGCQMNKYDSHLVEGRFRRRGWRTTESADEADLVLFNTCSVRDHAEQRVVSWLGELRRAKLKRPELMIGVMGCMAQRLGQEVFERADHVDLVCGTRQLQHLPELVDELRSRRAEPERFRDREQRVLAVGTDDAVAVARDGEAYIGGLHGFLAVMRGCNLNCTFCVVPRTRGRVQSRPPEEVVAEARWMIEQGCRAITLLGQTVNSYGEDLAPPGPGARGHGRAGRPSLGDLIRRLQELDGLERLRLVTLHPSYVTPDLARALAESPSCERFLPLPVQSGSDRVLRAMKRGYTVDLYRRRVDLLRAELPDLELGTDWIVGFPGEDEGDFQASLKLLDEQRFAVNYVFKYDPRPGTRADEVRDDDVPAPVKKQRNRELLAAAERSALSRMEARLGATEEVFVERASEDGGPLRGRTRHGLPFALEGDTAQVGTTVRAVVHQVSAFGLAGTLAQPAAAPR